MGPDAGQSLPSVPCRGRPEASRLAGPQWQNPASPQRCSCVGSRRRASRRAASSAIAARVNGTAISEDTVRDVVKSVIAGEPVPPSSEEIDRLTEAALDSLIDLELLYQEAERRKIQVGNEQIEDEIRHTRARFADEAQFDAALRHSGMSKSQLRAETRKTLLADHLLETVVWKGIAVTPEQVRRFYEENRQGVRPSGAGPGARPVRQRTPEPGDGARRGGSKGGGSARSDRGEPRLRRRRAQELGRPAQRRPGRRPGLSRAGRAARGGGEEGLRPAGRQAERRHRERRRLLRGRGNGAAPPGVTPFEDVEEAIRKTLLEEERERRRQAFVAKLREGAKIEIPTLAKPTPQGSPTPAPAGA